MMKSIRLTLFLLVMILIAAPSFAAEEEKSAESSTGVEKPASDTVSRFGFEATTWQEPLHLQTTQSTSGSVDLSVANFIGVFLSYEKQWRVKLGEKSSAFTMQVFGGEGQASGGGTSPSFNYKQGSTTWYLAGLEPRLLWGISESIDLGVGLAGTYRMVSFSDSPTTTVTPARSINAVFFLDADVTISERWALTQSIGLVSIDVGPMFRWGLTYKL